MEANGGEATLRLVFKNVLGQLYQITGCHSNAGQYQLETSTQGIGNRMREERGDAELRLAADKPASTQMQFGLALSTRRETPASLQIIAFGRHSSQRFHHATMFLPPRPASHLSTACHPRLEHSVHTPHLIKLSARQMSSNLETSENWKGSKSEQRKCIICHSCCAQLWH